MNALVSGVREASMLAIACLLPIAGAALAGGVAGGIVAARLGVQDQTLSLVGRAAGVLAAVTLLAASIGEDVRRHVRDEWSKLAAIGRGDAAQP